MPQLSRRVQFLLDDARYERLETEARRSGSSVGALLRDAIDRAYPVVTAAQAHAAREFLRIAEADPLPVVEWEKEKEHFRDEMSRTGRHDD